MCSDRRGRNTRQLLGERSARRGGNRDQSGRPTHASNQSKGNRRVMTQPTITDAWVLFLDVYGFTAMTRREDPKLLYERLSRAHAAIHTHLTHFRPELPIFVLSDSVFILLPVATPADALDQLSRFVDPTRHILGSFLKFGLPARGGFAFGSVVFDRHVLVGEAVARAAKLEPEIPAPLVVLPEVEVQRAGIVAYPGRMDSPPEYLFLKRKQLILGRFVTPFPVEEFAEAATRYLEQYALEGPYELASAWLYVRNELLAGMGAHSRGTRTRA